MYGSDRRLMNARFQGAQIVTLFVGEDKFPFPIHRDVLSSLSPVFRATFQEGRFAESVTQSMELPEDDPKAVEDMVRWMYTRQLRTGQIPDLADSSDPKYLYLAKLNHLADKYDIKKLTNAIIDEHFNLKNDIIGCGWRPQTGAVEHVYLTTTETSVLRTLLVAWEVWNTDLTWIRNHKSDFVTTPEYAADLAVAFAGRIEEATDPFSRPASEYHVKDEVAQEGDGKSTADTTLKP